MCFDSIPSRKGVEANYIALRDKSGFVAEYDLVCRVDVYVSFTCDRA